MKIIKIDAQMRESIVSEKAHGLSAHFERLRTGAPATQSTPLYRGKDQNHVFKSWLDVLEQNRKKFPRLVDYEFSRMEKTGPQGETPPLSELLSTIELYYTRFTTASIRKDPNYPALIARTREKLFGTKHSLRPMKFKDILQRSADRDALHTNSGLPDFSKRKSKDVALKAISDAESGLWKTYFAILGTRSSRGKARAIFMFPMSTNLVEQSFVVPIMDVIRSRNLPSFAAWEGFDDVEQAFKIEDAFTAKTKVAMDYEGMDQTMGPDQQLIVYDILAPIFQPQFRESLKESLLHVNEIPIMISNDKILEGKHGLASGSGWTNLSESIISQFVHDKINDELKLIGDQLLGDDGAFTTNVTDINLIEQVIESVSRKFGLTAKPEKQSIDFKTLNYLQRFFDEEILDKSGKFVVGSYPTVYALNACLNPERFHDPRKWSGRMEILRWIMILENTKHHPLFHQLIEYVAKGDRYDLGRAIPGYLKREIVQDYKLAKAIPGFVPSYNQASLDRGIQGFAVVKYLRRK